MPTASQYWTCADKMDATDLESIRRYFERILQSQDFLNKVAEALKSMNGKKDPASIARAVSILFARTEEKAGAKAIGEAVAADD